jgi:hypothetical protein
MASAKNIAVFGIYPTYDDIENAVDILRRAGFRSTDISFLMEENVGSKDLGHRKASKAPEGIAIGGSLGVILGILWGWLLGSGAVSMPGFGAFLDAGRLVAALAGAGALGVAGGLIGGIAGRGTPEYEVKRFEGRVRKGGNLLSVHCDNSDWMRRAKTILHDTGADDVASTEEAAADFARTIKPIPRTAAIDQEELWRNRGV